MAGIAPKNRADVADAPLARLDQAHFYVLLDALNGTGVVSNPKYPLGFTATGTGTDRIISLTAGTGMIATAFLDGAAGTVTPAAGDATYGRKDLIVVDVDGVYSVVAGTAAATPTYPARSLWEGKVALWGVYVAAGATTLTTAKLEDLRGIIPGEYRYNGDLFNRQNVARMMVFGHSLARGLGASDTDRDSVTHLSAMLPTREIDRSVSGAVLHSAQGGLGDGGYAAVMQHDTRQARPAAVLGAQANAGTNTLTLTTVGTPPFTNGQMIHVGNGDTGGSGGETAWIQSGGGTTTLTLTNNLVRTHANGQAVFEVPTAYIKQNPLYLLWYGANDLGRAPITSAYYPALRARYTDSLRAILTRVRAAEVFENNHPSCVYTGTWAADTTPINRSNSGNSLKQATVVNDKVTIAVPDNYPGTPIGLQFVNATGAGTDPVWTFTVDGVAAGTLTVYDSTSGAVAKVQVKRLTGLAPGRHVIEAQLTTLGSRTAYFDCWTIGALEPPLVIMPGMNRMPNDWGTYASAWLNAPQRTTLSATYGVGSTVITIPSTTGWQQGTTITFEEGTGNAETGEVKTIDSGTQLTLVAATTKSHNSGTAVRGGLQDADVPIFNTMIQQVGAEFDDRVVYVDTDSIINENAGYFWRDGAHFNDLGHVVLVKAYWEAFERSRGMGPDLMAYTATPTAPNPSELIFGVAATITWTNQPAAETELLGQVYYRKVADFRRVNEVMLYGTIAVAGLAGARIAVQYSTDSGTTWVNMGRDSNFSPSTNAARDAVSIPIDSIAVNPIVGTWQPVPPEAMVENLWLRCVGYGGDGVADPSLRCLILVCR